MELQDKNNGATHNSGVMVSAKQSATHAKMAPAYQIYLENRRKKETVLFARISIVLVILLAISATLASGILPVPFLDGFSKNVHYAQLGEIPCPIGDKPLEPKKVKVSVLNGTEVDKLATKTGSSLKELNFTVSAMSNADNQDYETPVLILTSAETVDEAYTVSLAFPNAQVKLSASKGIKVILGKGFSTPIEKKEFEELLKKPLEAPKSCFPVK